MRAREAPQRPERRGGRPADDNPLGLGAPTVLAVGPLPRELILACTRHPADDSPERHRLRAVLRDRLRASLVHADPRTLAALGAATGASERTLSRLFRGGFGMTFPQWRTQSRHYHALCLLADDVPVTTVAHRCGWSSASAFIDVFHRSFDYTPGTHNRRSR